MGNENNKSWYKLEDENDVSYARFLRFLEFDGTLLQFAVKEGISKVTIKRASSQYEWRKRKLDYIAYNQSIKDQAIQEVIQEVTKQSIEDIAIPLTNSCAILVKRLEKMLQNPDDIITALPPDQALNATRILTTAMQKVIELNDKLDTDTEKKVRIIPRLVAEED